MKRRIRTLVVDDNAPFREALKFFFADQPDIELVGLLIDGTQCLTFVDKHPVDVVIMDAASGGGYGNPLERDLDLVEGDVMEGCVSVERAKEGYGVVIDPETLKVDGVASKKLREELKKRP